MFSLSQLLHVSRGTHNHQTEWVKKVSNQPYFKVIGFVPHDMMFVHVTHTHVQWKI